MSDSTSTPARAWIDVINSPNVLVSGYYFFMFLSVGSGLPYFALWMSSIELSGSQIGLIAAGPSFAMVLTTVFAGSLADQAKDWRSAILLCNWLITLIITGLFFTRNFYSVFVLWMLWGLVMMAKFPIFDAAAIRMARQRGIEYHKMRAYGSSGFIVGVLLGGKIFATFGIGSFVIVLWLLALLRSLLAHALPYFREGIDENASTSEQSDTDPVVSKTSVDEFHQLPNRANPVLSNRANPVLYQSWFLLVLAGSAMIQGSHAYYYTFSAVLWTEVGHSTTLVSWLWALGVVVEVVLMWTFAAIAKKTTARFLLITAAVLALVRWLVFGFDPELWVLVLVQPLHGVTFALMFLATVNFIANWTPVQIAAKAQALSATFNTLCMAVATVAAGYLHTSLGARGYWAMAILCVLAVLLIGLSFYGSGRRSLPLSAFININD